MVNKILIILFMISAVVFFCKGQIDKSMLSILWGILIQLDNVERKIKE